MGVQVVSERNIDVEELNEAAANLASTLGIEVDIDEIKD
jgi:hypothetical protein